MGRGCTGRGRRQCWRERQSPRRAVPNRRGIGPRGGGEKRRGGTGTGTDVEGGCRGRGKRRGRGGRQMKVGVPSGQGGGLSRLRHRLCAPSCGVQGRPRSPAGSHGRVSLALSRAWFRPLPGLREGPEAGARGKGPRSPSLSSVYRASRPVRTRPGSRGPAPAPALLGLPRPARRPSATACALRPGRAAPAPPIGPNSCKPA